mmetsp:Transcript_6464/g.24308  ORF Transcript_6464/g.24308 Transcript_6464/m.24308 type:complete len:100 (-) Transcript_6464:2268-2567(-)
MEVLPLILCLIPATPASIICAMRRVCAHFRVPDKRETQLFIKFAFEVCVTISRNCSTEHHSQKKQQCPKKPRLLPSRPSPHHLTHPNTTVVDLPIPHTL